MPYADLLILSILSPMSMRSRWLPCIAIFLSLQIGQSLRRAVDNVSILQSVGDAIDFCGQSSDGLELHEPLLELTATTSRGQENHLNKPGHFKHGGDAAVGAYHLPKELLIVCHSGTADIGQLRTVSADGSEMITKLTESGRADLFTTMRTAFLQSQQRRSPSNNGNFVFVVDIHGNLLIAPVMQGNPAEEVKHGDLTPGRTPVSRPVEQNHAWGEDKVGDHAYGMFRGLARFGGEFDLLENATNKWVIHQKSGYSLARIQPSQVAAFKEKHPGVSDDEIWEQLRSGCFKPDAMLGLDSLQKFNCYMSHRLGVSTRVDRSYSCYFGSDAEAEEKQGNLPVLERCVPQEEPSSPCGSSKVAATSGAVSLTLAEWTLSPASVACNYSADDMTSVLASIETDLKNYKQISQAFEAEAAETLADRIRKTLRALKKSPCWTQASFAKLVKPECPLTSCMFSSSMKGFFDSLGRTKHIDIEVVQEWWDCVGFGQDDCQTNILDFWTTRCVPTPEDAKAKDFLRPLAVAEEQT